MRCAPATAQKSPRARVDPRTRQKGSRRQDTADVRDALFRRRDREALLESGADPKVADDSAVTALMWAVTDLEKTALLVERGADVNARSVDGRTPL